MHLCPACHARRRQGNVEWLKALSSGFSQDLSQPERKVEVIVAGAYGSICLPFACQAVKYAHVFLNDGADLALMVEDILNDQITVLGEEIVVDAGDCPRCHTSSGYG